MPIGAKLPLAAGALVLVVTAAMGYAAHEASRQALLDTARQRQTQVAKSFANMLGRASATAYRAQVAGMAKKPALRAYLQQPESADRFSALDALEFTSTSRIQDTQVVAMELVSASGTVLLATGREASLARTFPGRSELPWPVKADSAMLGHYRLVGDRIVFPVVSRVGDGEPAGFIVMWRRVQQSADTRQLISDLVGTSGKMLFGNDDGSVWHDIGAPIGWHKDKAVFGDVIGISLLSAAPFRLRRPVGEKWERVTIVAEPRSVYLLRGPSRTEWEHSIPPVERLRYSVTFRNFVVGP
jgi:hypothetical protein